jgi:hypothetical protein
MCIYGLKPQLLTCLFLSLLQILPAYTHQHFTFHYSSEYQESLHFINTLFPHKDFSQCGINTDPSRIANSKSIGLWPWMGSLGSYKQGNWSHACGATLIGETAVITAAHCVNLKQNVLTK